LVGHLFGQQLPKDHSETVHVRLFVDLLFVPDDFGGHPLIGAHSGVLGALLFLSRESEVAQLHHIPILANQHVGAFEVAVEQVFHVVEVDHPFDDLVGDLYLFDLGELLVLFVELVEEAAVFEVLGDEDELVGRDADAHVEHDVGVLQVADDHHLLHEVLFVVVFAGLHVVFDGDLLADVLPFVDFAVAAFSDQLKFLQIFFFYEEL
jgi:hypothetical protein